MSLVLLLAEALVFVAVGALLVSPWPFWLGGVVLIGFGLALALARDADAGRAAVDDHKQAEALRRQYLGEWR